MTSLKQSISWWCFEQVGMSPVEIARAAVDIGYTGVELVGREHWPLVKDHGLEIVSIQGHALEPQGLNRRENREQIEKQLCANLELAVKWGIPNLICFSGNRVGLDDETGAEITAENLHYLARFAEDAGVTLVLELLNSKIDHPDYQCDRTGWGVKVCRMAGSPRVKLLYDIYHMQVMEGDIIHTIQENHAYFGHYHTAGNPGRNEIDDSQELFYPAIVRAVLATGYQGYLGQEFIPKGDPTAGLEAAFALCRPS